MRFLSFIVILFGLTGAAIAAAPVPADTATSDPLVAGFTHIPHAARPGVYWWWLDGIINREGITRDLEAFAAKGVGEVLLVNSANPKQDGLPPGGVAFLSPEWHELFRHALREANRLGIDVGVNLCGGWCMGGPWIPPRHSGRWFLQSQLTVDGPRKFSGLLPLPGNRDGYDNVFNPPGFKDYIDLPLEKLDYRDTAVVAFPDSAHPGERIDGERKKTFPAKTNRKDASNFARAGDVMGPTLAPWPAAAKDAPIPASKVVDLTSRMSADGKLDWDVPPGRWTIVRTGHRMTGSRVMIPPPEADGLSVDWLAPDAVDLQFENLGRIFLADAAAVGVKLKYFCDDSFEDGFPNWTEKIVGQFRRYRGYDPVPYLPVLSGYIVGSAEISDRFLYDYRRTVADCMADGHYGRFATLCHDAGMLVQNEAAGPSRSGTMCMDGLMNLGRSDRPMGEFWLGLRHDEPGGLDPKLGYGTTRLEDGQNKVTKMVASAADLYGQNVASAEAFTTYRHWLDSPATLKPALDRAFCEGINRIVVHESTATREGDRKPGYEYYAGTHFNRSATWWEMSGGFLDYIARCQFLLRQGHFVADVLYYNGDWAPNLVLPKHAPADLGAGYDYDACNTEVLLTRLSVTHGQLVLPDGMRYRVLVLPNSTRMTVPVARKLRELVAAGATVIGPPPGTAPGLQDFPHCDEEVRAIAAELWADADGKTKTEHRYGSGRVVCGKSTRDILTAAGVGPDFNASGPPGTFDFIHRTAGEAECYFVSNRTGELVRSDCSFRVGARQPELWDPVTGEVRPLAHFSATAAGVTVPLEFAPHQSWFVVFRRSTDLGSPAPVGDNFPTTHSRQALAGPWTVHFDPKGGGPAQTQFAELTDWSTATEQGIRFYSGTATYVKEFEFPAAASVATVLDLGRVKDIAAVRLNGVDLGTVWTAPWRVDLTRALRSGRNVIEIDVANEWPNRLIGDQTLPPERRFTWTNIPLPKDAHLLSSGLLGPVTLLSISP